MKDVQYLMGHSSAAITLDVYSHVDISSAGDKHDPGPGRKSITTPLWPNCYTTYYTIWSQNARRDMEILVTAVFGARTHMDVK